MFKMCPKCKEEKPLTAFFNNKKAKDGKTARCKPCHTEYSRKYAKNNPDVMREVSRRYYYTKQGLPVPPRKTTEDKLVNAIKRLLHDHHYKFSVVSANTEGDNLIITLEKRGERA